MKCVVLFFGLCIVAALATGTEDKDDEEEFDFFYTIDLKCTGTKHAVWLDKSDALSATVSLCSPADDLCQEACRPDGASQLRVMKSLLVIAAEGTLQGFTTNIEALWTKEIRQDCVASAFPGRIVVFPGKCISGNEDKICWKSISIANMKDRSVDLDASELDCVRVLHISKRLNGMAVKSEKFPILDELTVEEEEVAATVSIWSVLNWLYFHLCLIFILYRNPVIWSLEKGKYSYYVKVCNVWMRIPSAHKMNAATCMALIKKEHTLLTIHYECPDPFTVSFVYPPLAWNGDRKVEGMQLYRNYRKVPLCSRSYEMQPLLDDIE